MGHMLPDVAGSHICPLRWACQNSWGCRPCHEQVQVHCAAHRVATAPLTHGVDRATVVAGGAVGGMPGGGLLTSGVGNACALAGSSGSATE